MPTLIPESTDEGGVASSTEPEALITSFAFAQHAAPQPSLQIPPQPPPLRQLKLFPQNEPADHENNNRLHRLPGQPHTYAVLGRGVCMLLCSCLRVLACLRASRLLACLYT